MGFFVDHCCCDPSSLQIQQLLITIFLQKEYVLIEKSLIPVKFQDSHTHTDVQVFKQTHVFFYTKFLFYLYA